MKIIYENNWIGSKPYFYSEETGKHSKNINEVINFFQALGHQCDLTELCDQINLVAISK